MAFNHYLVIPVQALAKTALKLLYGPFYCPSKGIIFSSAKAINFKSLQANEI
jgi:hypothetical protein